MNTNPLIQKYINVSDTSPVISSEQKLDDGEVKLANLLHQEGNLIEAKSLYEDLFKSNPEKFEVLHLLGTLEAQLGNFKRAIELLERATVKSEHLWDSFYNLGNAYLETFEFALAAFNYRKSLKIKPNNDVVYNGLGKALFGLKDFEAALENYDFAIKLNDKKDAYYFNKGMVLIELKNLEDALECFQRAININDQELYYYYNIGLVQFNLEKYQESLFSFERVINISPGFSKAYLCKADVLVRLNQKIS